MNLEVLRSILSFLEEKDKDALLFSLARENAKYEPPLSAAAKNGRDDLVGLFLDKGADGEQKRYVLAVSLIILFSRICCTCIS